MSYDDRLNHIDKHIQEMKDDLTGWTSELNREGSKDDKCYLQYCKNCIAICENTIELLEKEKAEIIDKL